MQIEEVDKAWTNCSRGHRHGFYWEDCGGNFLDKREEMAMLDALTKETRLDKIGGTEEKHKQDWLVVRHHDPLWRVRLMI